MGIIKRAVVFILLFWLFTIPETSHANDLTILYSILSVESDGAVVRGTIRVLVQNLTNSDLHNVDLRLFLKGLNSIERGLLQFGRIPAGDIRSVISSFLFDATFLVSEAPIVWQVDYDVAEGGHKQVLLVGVKQTTNP